MREPTSLDLLAARARDGDRQAREELFRAEGQAVRLVRYSIAKFAPGRRRDEDLAADALAHSWAHLPEYDETKSGYVNYAIRGVKYTVCASISWRRSKCSRFREQAIGGEQHIALKTAPSLEREPWMVAEDSAKIMVDQLLDALPEGLYTVARDWSEGITIAKTSARLGITKDRVRQLRSQVVVLSRQMFDPAMADDVLSV